MTGNKQFFSEVGEDGLHRKKFRTIGNVVSVLTALTISAHTAARNLISSHASFYKVSCFSLPGQDKTVTRRAAYFPGDTASAKVSYVHALLALATAGLPYLQYATLEQVEQL